MKFITRIPTHLNDGSPVDGGLSSIYKPRLN